MEHDDERNNQPGHFPTQAGKMPTAFDRLMGQLDGLPDVKNTKPYTKRIVPPLGVGGVETWTVQTYRMKEMTDQGKTFFTDTVFVEVVNETGVTRLVIPSVIADAMARQRETLSDRFRSESARRVAQDRKDRGELPGFLKNKKGGK